MIGIIAADVTKNIPIGIYIPQRGVTTCNSVLKIFIRLIQDISGYRRFGDYVKKILIA
jgi:hypothetical protein